MHVDSACCTSVRVTCMLVVHVGSACCTSVRVTCMLIVHVVRVLG